MCKNAPSLKSYCLFRSFLTSTTFNSHLFKLMIMHFKKVFIYCLEIPIFSGVTRHPYMLVVRVAMKVWCFTLWRWFLKISLCKIQMQSQWLVIANLRANLKRNYQVLIKSCWFLTTVLLNQSIFKAKFFGACLHTLRCWSVSVNELLGHAPR